jgi:hypothetical protein
MGRGPAVDAAAAGPGLTAGPTLARLPHVAGTPRGPFERAEPIALNFSICYRTAQIAADNVPITGVCNGRFWQPAFTTKPGIDTVGCHGT